MRAAWRTVYVADGRVVFAEGGLALSCALLAGATALASFLNLFHILAILSRHMQLPAHRILPFGYYGKVLAVALVSAGATWGLRLLRVLPFEELPRIGATVVAYGVVFLVVGSLTGVISREDRGHLWDWIRLKYLR